MCAGSRHNTPDTADERITNLPPRQYGGPRGRGGVRRDNRRDDRRRTTDDEDTILDSQDVSSVDQGECRFSISNLYESSSLIKHFTGLYATFNHHVPVPVVIRFIYCLCSLFFLLL